MWARVIIALGCVSCGSITSAPIDAARDAPPTMCPGLEIRRDVLGNSSFEATACAPTSVANWAITKSAGWSYYVDRPLVSDNAGCGVANFGCEASWLGGFPNMGNGCLAVWGGSGTGVGEYVEVREAYQAPAPIQKLTLAYSRGSDQLDLGWAYDLAYEIGGSRTIVETVTDTSTGPDPMGRFTSQTINGPGTAMDIVVSIRLRRIGSTAGNVWAFMDDVTLDVCY